MGKKIVDVTAVVRDASRAQHGLVVTFSLRFSSLSSSPGDRFCFPSSYNSQNAFFLLKFRIVRRRSRRIVYANDDWVYVFI